MVMEGGHHHHLQDDNMQCPDHPYRNSTPPGGGICAFCLQEKLGKLVSASSSFPPTVSAIFPASSSSSSSPSFRSHLGFTKNPSSSAVQIRPISTSSSSSSSSIIKHTTTTTTTTNNNNDYYYSKRPRLPFLLIHKKKKRDPNLSAGAGDPTPSTAAVFKRSKSTVAPRHNGHILDGDYSDTISPRRKGFWSFLYQSKQQQSTNGRKSEKSFREISYGAGGVSSTASTVGASGNASFSQRSKVEDVFDENDDRSPNRGGGSMERKVARSRSVGCGSRSFSGDFFERISTGFGDCALRRVESQREGKPKVSSAIHGGEGLDCIKERVKCGGIFGGFMMNSSNNSSSLSSSYWVSSSLAEENVNNNGGRAAVVGAGHVRSRSWGWAFASPIRGLGKRSEALKKKTTTTTNTATATTITPNLAAIPSLLAVRS